MKYIFVINPKAGKGDSKNLVSKLLENKKFDYEIYETKGVGDATNFVNNYIENNKDEKLRFIACGGDGTINEVVNACAKCENVSFTPFPSGSGNDFVKCFPNADYNDLDKILSAKEKKIDLIQIDDKYSINVVNFGFDTAVAKNVNNGRDKRGYGKKSDYILGVIKAIFTSMKNRATIVVDGKQIILNGDYTLCTLSNGQYVGGSFRCAPFGLLDDGKIEFCMIKPISLFTFLSFIGIYSKGEHLEPKNKKDFIVYQRAEEIYIKADKNFEFSLDGEIINKEEFTAKIVPKALNLAIPY